MTNIEYSCGQGGIGEALVKEYQARGIRSIATVLPSEAREHLVEAGVLCFSLDVTKQESVDQLKKDVAAVTGAYLDILVNNAFVSLGLDSMK